jgi:hypothetical protein
MKTQIFLSLIILSCMACHVNDKTNKEMQKKVDQYARVELTADISDLSYYEKEMLRYLFEAADLMDDIFWQQAYGDKEQLLDTLSDSKTEQFVIINYGPWERLNGNLPFIASIGSKPKGANFYPSDMTQAEFDAITDTLKNSQYSIIQRNDSGKLIVVPYHTAYLKELEKASILIKKAASYSPDSSFKSYLLLRAEALLTDNYRPSDMDWMDMKDNSVDFVFGPIENYEDQLYGLKTSYEAYLLLKDKDWSARLNKYAALLPELQKKLPVDEAYKSESPGSNSDLAVYDVLYYAGDCNAGSKTIAINLPNDETVQLIKGSRRLQLKNAMKAKFDRILMPIAEELIDNTQLSHVTFDAFFEDVMFHEVAHGLGIKNTITGKGTVREALKEQYSALEEGKADILGLFLIYQLNEMGELQVDMRNSYTTFLAGIFRSIRFGSSSAHGNANLVRFNYFREKGAFSRSNDGKYLVDFDKIQQAVNDLSRDILIIQGNGDYEAARKMIEKYGVLPDDLKNDLEKINKKGIPVDIVFDQGPIIIGL